MRTLLALILTLLLTGCAAASMVNVKNDALPEVAETAEMAAEEVIRYQVETVAFEETERAENGEHLVTYSFNTPYMTAVRADGTPIAEAETPAEEHALVVAGAFNRQFEEWTAAEEFLALAEEAEADLAWHQDEGLEWRGGYTLELDCTVYQTDRLVSVSGLYYSDTGGAHPNTWRLGWNFDLEEGTFFEPEMLADGTELREAVSAEIIRQAGLPTEDGYIPVETYWEDYEAIIANWGSYAVSFDESGMTVAFSPYELAPYASGTQEFEFTYDWLESHLGAHGRALLGLETE